VAQHLVTLNKIVFNTGGFSGSECTKIVFVFGRGSVPESDGEGRCRLPIPVPLHAFSVSMSGRVLFNMTVWQS